MTDLEKVYFELLLIRRIMMAWTFCVAIIFVIYVREERKVADSPKPTVMWFSGHRERLPGIQIEEKHNLFTDRLREEFKEHVKRDDETMEQFVRRIEKKYKAEDF